ncbi:unnamed protein product [Chrysoparadoxa australica]
MATPTALARASETVTPQGVLAIVNKPSLAWPGSVGLDGSASHGLTLVLDGIGEPGNLGTLCRTGAALGVDGIILLHQCVDVWGPKALRSSMGASFRVPITTADSWQEAKEFLNSKGTKNVYAADGAASARHFDIDWTQPTALVIGSEAAGLSDAVMDDMKREDKSATAGGCHVAGVGIPLASGIESLNAAAAGAVILGEACRQRQG